MLKKCKDCGFEKPFDEFHDQKYKLADGTLVIGKRSYCKVCGNKRSYSWKDKNYEKSLKTCRDFYYRKEYGITSDERDRILTEQDGRCKICGTNNPGGKHDQWCLDHVHDNFKRIRGVLCNRCNRALGLFRDDEKILASAILYLQLGTEGERYRLPVD